MTVSLDLKDDTTRAALSARAAKPVKASLIGLNRSEVAAALVAAGIVPERQAKMRAQQLWHWMYVRGVSDFAGMFNISKDLRAELDSISPSAGPKSSRSRFPPTARESGCFAFRRAAPAGRSRSRPSISPRKAAARSASPRR